MCARIAIVIVATVIVDFAIVYILTVTGNYTIFYTSYFFNENRDEKSIIEKWVLLKKYLMYYSNLK